MSQSGFTWFNKAWNSSLVCELFMDRKLIFSAFNLVCLRPGVCFWPLFPSAGTRAAWGELTDSEPDSASEDSILKLFTDSNNERSVVVTDTEWSGDPHTVQNHEKSELFVWKLYVSSSIFWHTGWNHCRHLSQSIPRSSTSSPHEPHGAGLES